MRKFEYLTIVPYFKGNKVPYFNNFKDKNGVSNCFADGELTKQEFYETFREFLRPYNYSEWWQIYYLYIGVDWSIKALKRATKYASYKSLIEKGDFIHDINKSIKLYHILHKNNIAIIYNGCVKVLNENIDAIETVFTGGLKGDVFIFYDHLRITYDPLIPEINWHNQPTDVYNIFKKYIKNNGIRYNEQWKKLSIEQLKEILKKLKKLPYKEFTLYIVHRIFLKQEEEKAIKIYGFVPQSYNQKLKLTRNSKKELKEKELIDKILSDNDYKFKTFKEILIYVRYKYCISLIKTDKRYIKIRNLFQRNKLTIESLEISINSISVSEGIPSKTL